MSGDYPERIVPVWVRSSDAHVGAIHSLRRKVKGLIVFVDAYAN